MMDWLEYRELLDEDMARYDDHHERYAAEQAALDREDDAAWQEDLDALVERSDATGQVMLVLPCRCGRCAACGTGAPLELSDDEIPF